jgi:sulfite exporter TauE/SafE
MRAWSGLTARTCATAGRWRRSRPITGPIGAGMGNALLPCGLVYAALATAAAEGSAVRAIAFMAAFGIGTMPALLALSLSAGQVPRAVQPALQKAAPVVLMLIAALLIMRGVAPETAAASAGVHAH